ncbi:hypothetical protein CI109_100292 [Kwoniella shandongensis]|uniref:rRNA adenine N(6)-methyltransferase n=1 Tax=Kwoniella shandongensis TaxID=1734106 RepID=A0A5M6C4M0_9TREE|nr:uncharacterized protein CI109_001863 [Kwoniella shandongensis]KAA5529923.1 hypothetical protein CI109_001863 [Kwoniella shandongensis]
MPPRPRLPPLPPSSKWSTHFPARYLPVSPDKNTIRKTFGRVLVTNPSLADKFVRAMGIREGEVIVENYAGVGGLTRSLLSGGDAVGEAKKWIESQSSVEGGSGESSPKTKTAKSFPRWIDDIAPSGNGAKKSNAQPVTAEQPESTDITLVRPKLVLASEGSAELITRAYDYPASSLTPSVKFTIQEQLKGNLINSDLTGTTYHAVPVAQSSHDPSLLLSHSTVYIWPTLPALLSDPLVSPHLEVYDPAAPPGPQATKRPWDAEPPKITMVCQVPDSPIGEQLVAQWVGSAVGDLGQERTWVWQWGRVRMALLVGKSLYDRIMAKPGDLIHCKLSILSQALFDITPLPPYHHVRNVDKQSKITTDRPVKPSSKVPKSSIPPVGLPPSNPLQIPVDLPKTTTYPTDFFPLPKTATSGPLPRPTLLGLMMTPKRESPILASQKDAWDYVMRRLFVRDTLTLGEGFSNLSFGAASLLPIIESETDEYRGIPVDRRRVVRELEVEEWARIVDVFDKWPFKPDNLILDSSNNEEFSREVGQD